jgi:hypothetical protein
MAPDHVDDEWEYEVDSTSFGRMRGLPKYQVSYGLNHVDDDGISHSGIRQTWNGVKERRRGVLELPQGILTAFQVLYYSREEEETSQQFLAHAETTIVEGFTEYVAKDGTVYRAHPNYQNRGPWYDWAIIPCPHKSHDMKRNPDWKVLGKLRDPKAGEGLAMGPTEDSEETTNKRGAASKKKDKQNELVRMKSYCMSKFGLNHVPAKVLAFFSCPENGKPRVLVQACRPWMQKNYDRSSVIFESWHLQVLVNDKEMGTENGKNKGTKPLKAIETYLTPQYMLIPATELKERIYVVEETPGIHESLPNNKDVSGHCILVTDRMTNWAPNFL